jgi:hypothetical protein
MTSSGLGLWLLVAGGILALLGLLVMTGALSWFGRLPGDIRFESEGGRVQVFVPLASMLLLSVGLSLLIALLRRLF